ncbi:hypothetical protein E2C01_091271 [Portunus trituberculatus]|uniref:Uncharacterized protein n=1 Tax=Portunus trituberculatus TaxID=210409 RepID=A0A5B7JN43_PORTR|nr:hypothetical protein [Portunus trituberculatus]
MFLCRQGRAGKRRNIWCIPVSEDVVANTATRAHQVGNSGGRLRSQGQASLGSLIKGFKSFSNW